MEVKREKNKGGTMGEIITGIKKSIQEENEDEGEITERKQIRKIVFGKEDSIVGNDIWNIVTAYNKKEVSKIMKDIKNLIPEDNKIF